MRACSPLSSLTAVVLCGGAGARMGGDDKPLRALLGRPLIERGLDVLRPQVRELLLVANRGAGRYAAYGRVVDDGAYAGRGPLAGIAAGLAAAATDWVLSVPGDAPLLPPDLPQRLCEALTRERAELALVHDGRGTQPLCALLPRRLLSDLRAFLDAGGTAPREWQKRYRCAQADCADWPAWAWSLNTPEEWSLAEERLRT